MLARAASGAIIGVDAHPVVVEAHQANGLPGVAVIGLARGAVRESDVRVRSAIIASGVILPKQKLVVNLLPAELPKEASALDLALAVSILSSADHLPTEALAGRRFYGELSLGGRLEPVRGAVLLADLARRAGDRELIVPEDNAREAAVIPGVRVIGARTLAEVCAYLHGRLALPNAKPPEMGPRPKTHCLSEVAGQKQAKRALEVAAAGGHNLLMVGPPGSGKTMLARRLPGILPALGAEESIEVTRIHSAAGVSVQDIGLWGQRPFRAPHHTASDAALCGGGSIPRPGEVTLAHRGVLFLDELPEFSRRALESLREPLEEGAIHIARAAMSLIFPARVMLVAAMNPCPCGRLVSHGQRQRGAVRPCLCSLEQVTRYRGRISGPLLDRVDLHVGVRAVPFRDYARHSEEEPSSAVLCRVLAARQRQEARLGPERTNCSMSDAEIRKHVPLCAVALGLVEDAMETHGLSTRAITRVLKVARTIADLAGSPSVQLENLKESLGLRLSSMSPDFANDRLSA